MAQILHLIQHKPGKEDDSVMSFKVSKKSLSPSVIPAVFKPESSSLIWFPRFYGTSLDTRLLTPAY
jgi:hypothetical protein